MGRGHGGRVVCKGAPEAVLPLLVHAPAQYEAAYQQLARQGTRVLALAFRCLPLDSPLPALRAQPRERRMEADRALDEALGPLDGELVR